MLRVRMDLQKARLASKPMPRRRQLPDEHRLNFLKTPWSSPTPATWFRTFTTIGFSLELTPISFLTPGVATWTTGSGRWTSKSGVRFVCCSRFRESKTFLFCVCALIFRREAIRNARWKLTGRVSRTTAETLASITPEDLAAAAKEMEEGTGAWSVLSDRPAVRALITSMQSVHAGASWTIYNKWYTRMIAISYIVQLGQPLWWLTFSPADTNSPIVLEVAGVKVDVTSRLKADFPDYAKRLQVVATNHVASAFFYHSVTEAVLKCLLRFGAKDGDGGVLGRVKGKMCFLSTLFLSRDVESLRVISRTVLRAHTFPLRSFFLRATFGRFFYAQKQRTSG